VTTQTNTPVDVDDLLTLFPYGTRLDEDGTLVVGGCRLDDVAHAFGTPTYVVAEDALRHQARRLREGLAARWSKSRVLFASKSFPARAVYYVMNDEGLGIDVAGGGELLLALDAGVPGSAIVQHGNAKSDDEIRQSAAAGVGTIVVDGEAEIERLERLGRDGQSVLLRVQPGVDPGTHAGMSTGQSGSKFGVPLADAPRVLSRIANSSRLDLRGIHLHLGSQMFGLEPYRLAIEAVSALGEFPVFDVGGGLAVRYSLEEHPPSVEEWLDVVTEAAKQHLPPDCELWVEPGRASVAESTLSLYRVLTIKRGTPTFVAVDGGIADNFEASIYMGSPFQAAVATRVGGEELVNVVGRQCESGDHIAMSVRLDHPAVGDVIAVPVTGAYTHTLANNYNGALRAPVVFCRDGVATPVVRRDTEADLLARELPFPTYAG
jgi:diaminopimelate decarboxylase